MGQAYSFSGAKSTDNLSKIIDERNRRSDFFACDSAADHTFREYSLFGNDLPVVRNNSVRPYFIPPSDAPSAIV